MKRIILSLSISLLFSCTEKVQQATLLFEQGKEQEERGAADSAIISYNKAIGLLNGNTDKKLLGKIYNQFGDLYLNNSLYPNAHDVFEKALKHNLTLKDKTQASYSLRGIGKSYAYRNKVDSALCYHSQACRLIPQIKDSNEIVNIYNNLAVTYLFIKQYDKAELYNTESLKLAKDSASIYRCYSIKADLFIANSQYDSAYMYLKKGTFSNNLYTRISCYLQLSKLSKQIVDTTNYLRIFHTLNDSIENNNQVANITHTQLHIINNERIKDKQSFTLWILFILSGGCIIIFLFKTYFKIQHQKKIQKIEKRFQDSETKIQKLSNQLSIIKDQLYSEEKQKELEKELSTKLQQLKKDLEIILNNIRKTGEISAKKFMKSKTYTITNAELNFEDPNLSQKQKEEFISQILKSFNLYIERLSVTSMSEEDYLLCCMLLIGFNTKACACIRNISETSIRSQKSRIREKIKTAFGISTAFDYLFKDFNKSDIK